MHPRSVGYISIKSNDSLDSPIIDPNFLTDKNNYDLNALYESLLLIDDIMESQFRNENKNGVLNKYIEYSVECKGDRKYNNQNLSKEQKLKQFIKDIAVTLYHPVGTCKLGDLKNDNMAVVNEYLQLKYVSNVRIIDGSIMPTLPSGNTQLPITMIAEKGAQMILDTLSKAI